MKDADFVWDPYHDQTYDLPRDIELTDESTPDFAKKQGSSFTLNSRATFTVKSNKRIVWGEPIIELPHTKINLKQGSLIFEDNGATTIGKSVLIFEGADLFLDNDASFLVDSQFARIAGGGPITISRNSRYNANCWEHTFADLTVTINGSAAMSVHAQAIQCELVKIRNNNTNNEEESLVLESTAGPAAERVLSFVNTTIQCGATSKSVIASLPMPGNPKGAAIKFESTSIEVSDQADLHIKADAPSVDAQCRFHIGTGIPTLRFTAYTKGHSPFDFIHHTYYPAIFDFARAGGGQDKGQLMIQTPASAFQFNAMMDQGAVTINGQPARPQQLGWTSRQIDGIDYFVVALDDKPR